MIKNNKILPNNKKLKDIQGIAFYNPEEINNTTEGIAAIPISNNLSKIIKYN